MSTAIRRTRAIAPLIQRSRLDGIRAERCRRSLFEFTRSAWPLVDPAMPFRDNWHVGAISEALEAVSKFQITNLVINIPPGFAKSILACVMFPAWEWTRNPSEQTIFCSYSDTLAKRDSMRTRDLINTEWYQRSFVGDKWRIKSDRNRQDLFETTLEGKRQALTVGGSGTGFRGNKIVVDDPINALDAHSEAARAEAIRWWDGTMPSRVNDPMRAAWVIIMQRLHEQDLTGHVLAQGGYEHLCLPMRFEADRKCVVHVKVIDQEATAAQRAEWEARRDVKLAKAASMQTPDELAFMPSDQLARARREAHTFREPTPAPVLKREVMFTDPRETEGELLFPGLYPEPAVAALETKLGAQAAGQLQQRPSPAEGGMFKKNHWRFYRSLDLAWAVGNVMRKKGWSDLPARPLPQIEKTIISLDCNFKEGTKNDRNAFVVIGTHRADRYILDLVVGRFGFNETLRQFRLLVEKWPNAYAKYVEDKANGPAVINTLSQEIPGIIAVTPEGGKEARAAAIQPQVQSGNVYLPEGAPWLEEFIEEFATFPNARHDDIVDTVSQGLIALMGSLDAARFLQLARKG